MEPLPQKLRVEMVVVVESLLFARLGHVRNGILSYSTEDWYLG